MRTPVNPHSGPEGAIDCTVSGDVLLIGINRPAERNGFTPRMVRDWGEAVTRLDQEFAQGIAAQAALAVLATRHSVRKALLHGPGSRRWILLPYSRGLQAAPTPLRA